MIDLRSLEVFFCVVKLGGFGRAAERLHMTQPAVSARIAMVEARYDVRLLNRGTHGAPVLTPKGRELYSYAERILALHGEMTARLAGPADLSGVVRIGAAETLVHTLLAKLLRALHGLHPQVTPEITVDISPNLQTALLAGELDVALLLGPVAEPRVRDVGLRDHELVWAASPGLAIGEGRLDLAALARWPILSYSRGTLPHAWLAELFSRPGLPPVRLFANSSVATILAMAVDGVGVGVLPRAVAERDVADGRLRLLDVEAMLPPLHFTASYLATPGASLARAVAELAGQVAQSS